MHVECDVYKYLCAFAHYTGGKLAIANEHRTSDRPFTHQDIRDLNEELRERGFVNAAVFSFSLFAAE